MVDFLMQYWGIIVAALLIGLELIIEREAAVKRIRDLIFMAEEKARKGVLRTGEDKFEWVVDNGYKYLPPVLKVVLTEKAFRLLVQTIFDGIMDWASDKGLT